MDIEKLKADIENGMIIDRGTWKKLVDGARVMKAALDQIDTEAGDPLRVAALARDYMEAL